MVVGVNSGISRVQELVAPAGSKRNCSSSGLGITSLCTTKQPKPHLITIMQIMAVVISGYVGHFASSCIQVLKHRIE